ncbi:MAG TPA: head GIN domain-containing protein [Pyrinomonadaceae bacterium]|nr:head GIN domain-containing protein [Pyrinomonadaceae bacterium]
MKKTLSIISLLLMAAALGGCQFNRQVKGSGTMKLDKRTVPAFSAVKISGAFEVEIVAQKEQSLEIEGDDNLLSLVKTEVSNGVLHISTESGFSTKHKISVRISVPTLDGVDTSGACDIVATNVKSDEFKIDASGAGTLQVSGETKKLDVDISGAGEVDAKDLHAQFVDINSSGAAKADVYATEELTADVSGAGNVNYYGDPKVVNEDKSGAGSISKR